MIAIKRLQGFFWVLLVTLGALFVYMISLQVGTQRNALAETERQILGAKSDIRYLETEFSARASMRQLETWNAEDFRYSAPNAQQYLNGERTLASLDGVQPNGPVYIATPVMTAMADTAVPTPKPAVVSSPANSEIRADFSVIRSAVAAEPREPQAKPAPSNLPVRTAEAQPNPVARKAARMAMLDSKLLDDRTLTDLSRSAAREKTR